MQTAKWGGAELGYANLDNLEEVVDAYRKGKIAGIWLSRSHGFVGESLDFLLEVVPDLEFLVISENKGLNCAALGDLKELRVLSVGETGCALNLMGLTKLSDLSIVCDREHSLPEGSVNLSRIYLRSFKSRGKDISKLGCFRNLKKLELVGGDTQTLRGIEDLNGLEQLSVSYLRSLATISNLCGTKIIDATFEACASVKDFMLLSCCKYLKVLRMSKCGVLPSLDFLNNFSSLEEFRFVKTEIEDKDMSPLLKMKRVGFLMRKGYSHTPEEIKKLIGQK